MTKKLYFILFTLLCTLILAACGAAEDPAASAVENYINALVKKDFNRMSALYCAEWESDARLEFESFQGVDTKIDELSCTSTGSNEKMVPVICEGKMIVTYDGEDRDFDLSGRTYKVVNQGGEFLVCGYME